MMNYAALTDRGVIRVTGEDKLTFLQGIVTQDMRLMAEGRLLYGCFLTPQGKYLVDFFATELDGAWLLDVDAVLVAEFIKRLTMFKLRSKVVIEDVSAQYAVYAFWGGDNVPAAALRDPRCEAMGYRLIGSCDAEGHAGDYTLWQMQNGVPGTADFERERTSMLEANMDMLHALSWDKGCYMGQELTARTHYRGLVKKRFLPVRLTTQHDLGKDVVVKQGDKTIGHIRRQYKDWAMAHIQIGSAAQGIDITIADQPAVIVIPEWFSRDELTTQP